MSEYWVSYFQDGGWHKSSYHEAECFALDEIKRLQRFGYKKRDLKLTRTLTEEVDFDD
jgi:hypothetical protein